MIRTDAIVLGAGIVGVSVALQLARRGLSVALVDRRTPGQETSYGNAGIIEGNTIFPPAFPSGFAALARIALKRSPEANYHLSFLPRALPWLLAFRAASRPDRLVETARLIRPLYSHAVTEHDALLHEAGATQFLRKTGWLKIYRKERGVRSMAHEFELAQEFGLPLDMLEIEGARALEPSLAPVFAHAVFWPQAASVSDPLDVTRAYVRQFSKRGGVVVQGDARSLHRHGTRWRVDTGEGVIDADHAIVALGPWTGDLLAAFGIRLPLGIKRGYHRHFTTQGDASLSRPVLDADVGYVITPMAQGIRLTTGAEIAARDAAPTPVQFERLLPKARELFPLGPRADDNTWLGARPCLPDSRPVIDRAPGQSGLWLAAGHAHWGLTLGPVTGRLIADMVMGVSPFIDPAPYRADRFC
jgi:D-amino-acid dehydrogenase